MNTEKIFTAFNKSGNELLLYRRDKDTYIDLNSDKKSAIYPKEDIDFSTITQLSKNVDLRKHMLKFFIKRKYKKDRDTLIETDKILLGLGGKIISLKKQINYKNISASCQYESEKNYGIYIENSNHVYINYLNEKIYKNKALDNEALKFLFIQELKLGDRVVTLENITLEDILKVKYLDKKSIKEFAYDVQKVKRKIISDRREYFEEWIC